MLKLLRIFGWWGFRLGRRVSKTCSPPCAMSSRDHRFRRQFTGRVLQTFQVSSIADLGLGLSRVEGLNSVELHTAIGDSVHRETSSSSQGQCSLLSQWSLI